MKIAFLVIAFLFMAAQAHAESWVEFEGGIGAAQAFGEHDGIWVQDGLAHSQTLDSPAFTAGITGDLLTRGRWSLAYHADYIYTGNIKVTSMAVSDANYNLATKTATPGAPQSYFSGFGHTQGVALTLAPGYNFDKWRFSVEGGLMAEWVTWHETMVGYTGDLSHKTTPQLTWIAGASISRGPISVSYRYFNKSQSWNPNPQYTSGEQMIVISYKF